MPLLPVPVDGNRQINLARQLRHCLHNYIQWHILYLLRYYSFVIAEWLLLTCIIRSTLLLNYLFTGNFDSPAKCLLTSKIQIIKLTAPITCAVTINLSAI